MMNGVWFGTLRLQQESFMPDQAARNLRHTEQRIGLQIGKISSLEAVGRWSDARRARETLAAITETRDALRLRLRAIYPEFAEMLVRAREAQAEQMVDEVMAIADDRSQDWMTRSTNKGEIRVLDYEHVQRSRLRVDARLKMMEKLAPTRYGQHSSVTVTTKDEERARYASLTPEQRMAEAEELIAGARRRIAMAEWRGGGKITDVEPDDEGSGKGNGGLGA
jgi:hypothetical protein